jgi:hypothetical protein
VPPPPDLLLAKGGEEELSEEEVLGRRGGSQRRRFSERGGYQLSRCTSTGPGMIAASDEGQSISYPSVLRCHREQRGVVIKKRYPENDFMHHLGQLFIETCFRRLCSLKVARCLFKPNL